MINPPAFTRTARGLPVRADEEDGEDDQERHGGGVARRQDQKREVGGEAHHEAAEHRAVESDSHAVVTVAHRLDGQVHPLEVEEGRDHRPEPERLAPDQGRSEERRVGKECRSRWWPYH